MPRVIRFGMYRMTSSKGNCAIYFHPACIRGLDGDLGFSDSAPLSFARCGVQSAYLSTKDGGLTIGQLALAKATGFKQPH